jgi:hypothetical protein
MIAVPMNKEVSPTRSTLGGRASGPAFTRTFDVPCRGRE